MKRILLILFCILLGLGVQAQQVVTFEEFDLPVGSFLNGSDGSGGFQAKDLYLPNDYNDAFMSWSGWAISATTDTTTPGFTNQYSSITGGGFDGSLHYAVNYAFGNNDLFLVDNPQGVSIEGFYITNSTYAYLSMRDGDASAKRFGGVTGDDPDFFLLTISAYIDGQSTQDSVLFYLADYRFDDNSQDYIVDQWQWVDLSFLGPVDSVSFELSSSDVGQFGMNTPAYFCMDNLSYNLITNTRNLATEHPRVEVFPNPAQTATTVQVGPGLTPQVANIYDLSGQQLHSQPVGGQQFLLDMSTLSSGIYLLEIATSTERIVSKIVKQ